MAEPLSSYKKLPGRAAGSVVGTVRLWYKDDHMISVSSAFGYESYQRVYFRDIESLIVRQTKGRLLWNILFGAIAAFIAVLIRMIGPFSEMSGDLGWESVSGGIAMGLVALAIPGVLALLALIINTAKGPTCTFWAQTIGGMTRLGAPVRARAARKVVNTLTPLIAKAQGQQPVSTLSTS